LAVRCCSDRMAWTIHNRSGTGAESSGLVRRRDHWWEVWIQKWEEVWIQKWLERRKLLLVKMRAPEMRALHPFTE
jgi:hypothetical protein